MTAVSVSNRASLTPDRVNLQPGKLPALNPPDVLQAVAALRTAAPAELKTRWQQLFDKEPPPFNRAYLQSRLTHRIQELAYGGLKPEIVRRLEALGDRLDGGNLTLRRIRADDRPIAGTKLVREFREAQHVITVLSDGFEYEGRPYRSLSAIAREITGTRWNGWTFFGLRGRGAA